MTIYSTNIYSRWCAGVLFGLLQTYAMAASLTDTGPNPTLPAPTRTLLPTVNVAAAVGWKENEVPTPAEGFSVNEFAAELDHPRMLYVLPNGDVLVAETNAPNRPDDMKGIKGWAQKKLMKKGGAGVPSANRITLLRDADHDGVAETRSVFAQDLNSPFGMALVQDRFYVANADAVVSFHYRQGDLSLRGKPQRVVELPAGTINHHWTKNLLASKDGRRLYVSVGSNSNAGENGLDKEEGRAAIYELTLANRAMRLYATGLRNPVGMDWQPDSGALWTAVNERDELGDDLVPDYITAVRDGGFYGWPYSYYGQHVDARVKPQAPDKVAAAIVPDYALGAHTASLGLCFYTADSLPPRYRHGAFIAQHGSWNRSKHSGYKVVFVPFSSGQPAGQPEDILTGFLDQQNQARGRPVSVVVNTDGNLLISDDVGNRIWRVTPTERPKP